MKLRWKAWLCYLLICAMMLTPVSSALAAEAGSDADTAVAAAAGLEEETAEEKEGAQEDVTDAPAEETAEEAVSEEEKEEEAVSEEETAEEVVSVETTTEETTTEETTAEETVSEKDTAEDKASEEVKSEEETEAEETAEEAEKVPEEKAADTMVVDDAGSSFVYRTDNLTMNCEKLGGTDNAVRATVVTASGDVVIPDVMVGTSGAEYHVTHLIVKHDVQQSSGSYTYTKTVWGFAPSIAAGITSITFPDTIREIPGNLFDWQAEMNESLQDLGMPNHTNTHGKTTISFGGPTSVNVPNTYACTNQIPAFIRNHYEDGAYYAGKCLVRVDPGFKGDLTVKDGTICILASAFEGCSSIRKVEIPDTVEYIGVRGFANSSVTEVNLPKGLEARPQEGNDNTIEMMTFYGCKYLKKVRIDAESIYKIGYEGFMGCSSLETFDMTKIRLLETLSFAFAFAKGYDLDLTETDQLGWVWGIFMGSGLSSVTFGDHTFESIWFEYFRNCKNLTKVVLTPYQQRIGTFAFEYCTNLTQDVLAGDNIGVTQIETHSFAYCGFKEITIPESMETMLGGAFAGNPQLETVNWRAPRPTFGAGNLFAMLDDSSNGMSETGDMVSMGMRALSMPSKKDTDVTAIKTLNIWNADSQAVMNFNSYFFAEEPYLETVNIHSVWTEIPNHAFFDCPSLKHVNLDYPEKVEKVDFNAFGASGLEEAELLPGAEYVRQAFMCCMNLKKVTVPDGVEEIGANCFYLCKNLKKVEVENPAGLKTVRMEAFGQTGLEEVVIMKGVTYERAVFQLCPNLKKVVVEDGVTELAPLLLEGAPNLEKAAIPDSVKIIGQGALKNSGKNAGFYVSDQVTLVEDDAFGYDRSLGSASDVLLAGDPQIELYHPGYSATSTKYTAAFDKRVVQGVWMRGDHPNYEAYLAESDPELAPETRELPAQTVSVSSLERYIGVGEMPDKTKVTVEVDGKALSQDEFDLVFDTEDMTTGERTVKVVLKKETDQKVLLRNEITACNFYTVEKSGPVWQICDREELSFPIEVRAYLTRVYGNTRYTTGLAAIEAVKRELGVSKFPAIIVATGQNFADALVGSYLSAQKKAPIVLINEKNKAMICSYIRENLDPNGTLYILGGTKALPWEWLYDTQYWIHYDYKRIAANTRYLTAIEILKEAGVRNGEEVLICTGENFADSLSAASTGKPLFLVKNSLNAKQKAMLQELKEKGCTFTILGGEKAVSAEVEAMIREEVGDALAQERISGKTRYLTSAMIAERYFQKAEKMLLVTGENYPDGLCG
ncbi:MAG: leucine-rich repeat protein, partial [Lachnospiraceae bacterium]|nr:leucine-rich repeat protein [Lachnospiraceae bacterium]